MMKKTTLSRGIGLLMFLLSFTFISFSQNNFRVTGKVLDDASNPVQGASVQVKGTSIGTVTKADGAFELMAPSGNAVLVVTNIGYNDQEIPLDDKSEVTITMVSNASSLQDVVVIGYGTAKRKDVTGAVAGINQKDIRSRPVDNALQAMQGKVAGVDIASNERPGQVGAINIRGVRSLTASNTPLFVVDGIPLTTGGIDYLNPNDIESIDVLKDASATAIFGSRGANGVVIVTTKQGKTGRTQINLYSSLTTEKIVDWAPIMSAAEYIEFRRWAVYYSNPGTRPRGDNPNITNDRDIFLATADPDSWRNIAKGWAGGTWDGSKVSNTDWGGLVTQTGTP
jgi:TonB-dependent starch-binding outer membrane protein SusC